MRSDSPSGRVERTLAEAREARWGGCASQALSLLSGAQAILGAGPVRRELRVSIPRERGLCHVATGEPREARRALGLALERADGEATLADPVRADLAMLDLMEGDAARAAARLSQRRRDCRATLTARARLELWSGETEQAEQTLQACDKACGGTTDLMPPATALRCLVVIWQGRPEQARLLLEGVACGATPYWELVRLVILRALWVQTGDARYAQLGLGVAEQLRFESDPSIQGLKPAASAQHAALLSLTGSDFLAVQAADEAWQALGRLSLPEWPRAAILHDLAMVYRAAGRREDHQRMVSEWAKAPTAAWSERMQLVSGARAEACIEAPSPAECLPAGVSGGGCGEVALRLIEGRQAPELAFARALAEGTRAHGVLWADARGRTLARTGTALASGRGDNGTSARTRLNLPEGDTVTLSGVSEAAVARLDVERLGRLVSAARELSADHQRERELREAIELLDERRKEAERALERGRRGTAIQVATGCFPSVAGRSRAIAQVLDRLGLLAESALPVLLDGSAGTGRRHLARAFAERAGSRPECCIVIDMALVPAETQRSTLLRLAAEAAGGCWVVANAERVTPDAATLLLERGACAHRANGKPPARLVLTLDEECTSPVAESLRIAFASRRVRVPRLDERVEDLPDLIDALARQVGKRPEDVGTAARAVLVRRLWPGNVAELAAVIADAAVRSAGKTILPEHLAATTGESADPPESSASLSEGLDLGYHAAVRTFRSRLLRHALETTGGNRTRAAKLLGVQRTYFMRLIRDLGACRSIRNPA